MPSYLSRARSRVGKPQLKRTSSLPFTSAKPTVSLQRAYTTAVDELVKDNEKPGAGAAAPTANPVNPSDRLDGRLMSAIDRALSTTFDHLPERAGFNSVRIAEILNFQKYMPPIISSAHIRALRSNISQAERELSILLASGELRRIHVLRGGSGKNGTKEFLIKSQDYENLLRSSSVPDEIANSYMNVLRSCPSNYAVAAGLIDREHANSLLRAGFLVLSPTGMLGGMADDIASTSGTLADKSYTGYGVAGAAGPSSADAGTTKVEYFVSVPGIGAYCKLIDEAQAHFLDLLRKFSKHRHAPAYILRERWNGNVDDDTNQISISRRIRGEFANVLPSQTKKWKKFRGLSFDWVLDECLGAGLVETFETNSVGLGLRALN